MQAERAGDVAAAEALYRRVVLSEPKAFVAHNNWQCCWRRGGDGLDEAVASADAAVKLQPRQAAVYDTLAFVQSKSGDARGAAASMRTAADLEPTNAKWRIRLAAVPVRQRRMGGGGQVIDTIDSRLDLGSGFPRRCSSSWAFFGNCCARGTLEDDAPRRLQHDSFPRSCRCHGREGRLPRIRRAACDSTGDCYIHTARPPRRWEYAAPR